MMKIMLSASEKLSDILYSFSSSWSRFPPKGSILLTVLPRQTLHFATVTSLQVLCVPSSILSWPLPPVSWLPSSSFLVCILHIVKLINCFSLAVCHFSCSQLVSSFLFTFSKPGIACNVCAECLYGREGVMVLSLDPSPLSHNVGWPLMTWSLFFF